MFVEVFRSDGGDHAGFVVGVFDDRHSRQNSAFLQHAVGDRSDDLQKAVVKNCPVIDLRSGVFAQADQHHLVQTGFDRPDETGVRLHAP